MSMRDKNPRRYDLLVGRVETGMAPLGSGPKLELRFDGKLSARAKRDIIEAIKTGNFEIHERMIA